MNISYNQNILNVFFSDDNWLSRPDLGILTKSPPTSRASLLSIGEHTLFPLKIHFNGGSYGFSARLVLMPDCAAPFGV